MKLLRSLLLATAFTLISLIGCSNPLGGESHTDTSFSPGGDTIEPDAPVITGLTGSPSFSASPTVNWGTVVDATSYEVGIGNNIYYDNVVEFINVGNISSYQFNNINPLLSLTTTYYLMVRSIDSAGNRSTTSLSLSWSPGLVTTSGAYNLPEEPFYLANCAEYYASDYYNSEGDGKYWLDLDGLGGLPPVISSCMMDSNGGGWTLVLNYVHIGGSNAATNVKNLDLPVMDSDTLGESESTSPNNWGHASYNLLVNINFSEVMFYCRTSAHGRVMNFKTDLGGIVTYFTTGQGNSVGLDTNFTPLTGHSAILPATRNTGVANQGDAAMTGIPFAQVNTAHWSIRGGGGRWECDDFPNNAANSTIHRIWVR